ncbi:MAG: hypothetical protein AB8F94_17480 [Saprospiraceae bacterium]
MLPRTYEFIFSSNRPKGVDCYQCGAKDQIIINGIVKGITLFFIPLFPYKIRQEVSCTNCNTYLCLDEMDQPLRKKYKKYVLRHVPQFWHFAGILILIGIIIMSFISSFKKSNQITERLTQIEKGRIIEYETNSKTFSILKVVNVQKDSVGILLNKIEADSKSGISNIKYAGSYSSDTINWSKNKLLEMHRSKKVIDVYW